MVARTSPKNEWTKWRDRPRNSSRSDETQKRVALWQAFTDFVRKHRGWITTPPGSRTATLETEVGSPLPAKLGPGLSTSGSRPSNQNRRRRLREAGRREICRHASGLC